MPRSSRCRCSRQIPNLRSGPPDKPLTQKLRIKSGNIRRRNLPFCRFNRDHHGKARDWMLFQAITQDSSFCGRCMVTVDLLFFSFENVLHDNCRLRCRRPCSKPCSEKIVRKCGSCLAPAIRVFGRPFQSKITSNFTGILSRSRPKSPHVAVLKLATLAHVSGCSIVSSGGRLMSLSGVRERFQPFMSLTSYQAAPPCNKEEEGTLARITPLSKAFAPCLAGRSGSPAAAREHLTGRGEVK